LTPDDLYAAFDRPVGCAPFAQLVGTGDSVCIVTSDATRPFKPMRLMLHAVVEKIGSITDNITVLTGSGSHVPHSGEELREIFCTKLFSRLKIVSHDSRSHDNVVVGNSADGSPIRMNRHYVDADKRIVLGIIEPHIYAGYSGGPKGIAPAICDIETIRRLHSYAVIADPTSTYGDIEHNACQTAIRETAACAPPDFLVNVVLDSSQNPVAAYCGHYIDAHRAGVRWARKLSEVRVDGTFPVVITTNAGHPLDQNLYQSVKGMEAAFRIVEPGGSIVIASECAKGVPDGSQFEKVMSMAQTPETLLTLFANTEEIIDDQWQAQRLCRILTTCRVILVSSLTEEKTLRCKLEHAPTVEAALERIEKTAGPVREIGILADGPTTIPVVG